MIKVQNLLTARVSGATREAVTLDSSIFREGEEPPVAHPLVRPLQLKDFEPL